MKKYRIRIIETLEKEVTVSAADRKNALEIAEEKYSKAEDEFDEYIQGELF